MHVTQRGQTMLQQQGAMLGHQESRINATTQEVGILNAQVADLLQQVTTLQLEAGTPRTSLKPEPHSNNPPLYSGDPNSCQAFLSQCALVFALQPCRYATEEANFFRVEAAN